MRGVRLASLIATLTAALTVLANPTSASADPVLSLDALREAVGTPQIEVLCPNERVLSFSEMLSPRPPYMDRGVKVTLEKAGTDYRSAVVLNTLLVGGLQTALQQCPMQDADITGRRSEIDDVGFVDVYGRLSDDGPELRLIHAERYMPTFSRWTRVTDEGAQREQQDAAAKVAQDQQVAAAAAVRQQAQAAAVASQQAAQQQRVTDTQNAEQAVEARKAGSVFWAWARLLLVAGFLGWLWTQRDRILTWYYELTPHPAALEVDRMIYEGKSFDEDAFKRAFGVRGSNNIERAVRERQQRAAEEKLRRNQAQFRQKEERLRAEYAKLQEDLANLKRENAFNNVQNDLFNAALDYEIARARVDAAQKEANRK